jgi:hypothetical protein
VVPVGGRISEDSGVTRRAHPSAGTGRHGHGDWMVTDRWTASRADLLILRAAREAQRRPLADTAMRATTCGPNHGGYRCPRESIC